MLSRPLGGFCGVDRAAASERDGVTNCCVEGHGQLQENCLVPRRQVIHTGVRSLAGVESEMNE
jgi:hypothetical protein